MKHFVHNEKLEKSFEGTVTIYGCQHQDGHLDINTPIYKFGEESDVWFMPCEICNSRIVANVLTPLVKDSLKKNG